MSKQAQRYPTMHLLNAGMAPYMGIMAEVRAEQEAQDKARLDQSRIEVEYDELQAALVQMRMAAHKVHLKLAFTYRDGRKRYDVTH